MQLQPGGGFRGLLGPAATRSLKQLRLTKCNLLDGQAGLAAALAQLPTLEHLSVVKPRWPDCNRNDWDDSSDESDESEEEEQQVEQEAEQQQEEKGAATPGPTLASALRHLQRLTSLELKHTPHVRPPGKAQPCQPLLQHVRALTALLDLRLAQACGKSGIVTASMLSGVQQLTCLQVSNKFETSALAGMTRLEQLVLKGCKMTPGKAGMSQLLSVVGGMQQLTHLSLEGSLYTEPHRGMIEESSLEFSRMDLRTFVAAFEGLTASSRLQHLDISRNFVPPGVWTHMFAEGRPLMHLRVLNLGGIMNFPMHWTGPMGPRYVGHMYEQTRYHLQATRLVSCCPGLQDLDLLDWVYYPELLAPLQGLSSLSRLVTGSLSVNSGAFEAVVGHLTGLKELRLLMPAARASKEDLWQLTQLQELTRLSYVHCSGRVILTQVGACRRLPSLPGCFIVCGARSCPADLGAALCDCEPMHADSPCPALPPC